METLEVPITKKENWSKRRMLYQDMLQAAGKNSEAWTTDVLYDIETISNLSDNDLIGMRWGVRKTGCSFFEYASPDNERWYTIIERNGQLRLP